MSTFYEFKDGKRTISFMGDTFAVLTILVNDGFTEKFRKQFTSISIEEANYMILLDQDELWRLVCLNG